MHNIIFTNILYYIMASTLQNKQLEWEVIYDFTLINEKKRYYQKYSCKYIESE